MAYNHLVNFFGKDIGHLIWTFYDPHKLIYNVIIRDLQIHNECNNYENGITSAEKINAIFDEESYKIKYIHNSVRECFINYSIHIKNYCGICKAFKYVGMGCKHGSICDDNVYIGHTLDSDDDNVNNTHPNVFLTFYWDSLMYNVI